MAGNNFSGSNISFGFGEEDIIMAEEQPWWNGSAYGDSNAVEGLGHRDSINNNNNCCSCAHEPHLKRRKNPDHEAHGDEISPSSMPATLDLMSTPEGSARLNQQTPVCSIATSACPSSTETMPLYSDPLDDPRPLRLTLRKSQSLIDLIQQNLDQNDQLSVLEQGMEENTKAKETSLADSQQDKLKASNFPASHITIGKWQCSSVHEGDLVAKSYYAKRKLVWEVLENGLKSKIEIPWSDITGMKANTPDKVLGTLHIEVSRTPLFFRETNPQPRKHTLWQSTSDFTGGQASICRRHLLQFPEGVLNRHFDKLIQCDPRLKELSERSMPFSGSPFFEGQIPMLDMHPHLQFAYPRNVISTMRLGGLQNDGLMHYNHIPAPVVKQNNVHINEQLRERASAEAQPFSPSSVMDSRTKDESSTSDTEDQSAKDLRRHAGYKKTGTAMLFNQRSMHNRLASLKRGHKPSNVGSATMLSHPAIHDCEVFRCGEQNEKDALLNKHILERLYLHLLGDPLPENFLTNEQIAQCAQDLKQRVQQRKLLPSGLSEHTKMLSGPSTSDNSLTNNSGGHQL